MTNQRFSSSLCKSPSSFVANAKNAYFIAFLGILGVVTATEVTAQETLMPLCQGGLCGYYDSSGTWAIQPRFTNAEAFHDGLAVVREERGSFGAINLNGEIVVPAEFDSLQGYENGLSVYKRDGQYGVVDEQGIVVIEATDSDLIKIPNRKFFARKVSKNLWEIIDIDGHLYSKNRLETLNPQFKDNLTIVDDGVICLFKKNAKIAWDVMPSKQDCMANQGGWTFERVERRACNYVDLRGNKISQDPFTSCNEFVNGRAAVKRYKRTLIINEQGGIVKEVLKDVEAARLSVSDDFSDGFVIARSDSGDGRFVFSRSGNLVFQMDASYLGEFSENLAPFQKTSNGKYGFVDTTGKIVVEAKYDRVRPFQDGLAAVRTSTLGGWSFIDTTGAVVLETKYRNIKDFKNGFAIFETNDFGVIDKTGNVVIAPQFGSYLFRGDFSQARRFSEGFAFVSLGAGKPTYLNREGRYAFTSEISAGGDFKDGIAPAKVSRYSKFYNKTSGNWGVVDAKGEWVIRPDYQSVKYFNEELAPAQINDKWGFIDLAGRWVIEPQFANVGEFSEGIAPATDGEHWGYVDRHGEWVISPKFEAVASISEDLAVVKIDGKFGYINRDGKVVVEAKFDGAGNFVDGIAPASVLGKWGYIGSSGEWVITPDFDSILYASEDLIGAKKGDSWGFINIDGDWVISPMFQQVMAFSEGLAAAKKDDSFGYIDKAGDWFILPRYKQAFQFFENIAVVQVHTSRFEFIGRDGNWGPRK